TRGMEDADTGPVWAHPRLGRGRRRALAAVAEVSGRCEDLVDRGLPLLDVGEVAVVLGPAGRGLGRPHADGAGRPGVERLRDLTVEDEHAVALAVVGHDLRVHASGG